MQYHHKIWKSKRQSCVHAALQVIVIWSCPATVICYLTAVNVKLTVLNLSPEITRIWVDRSSWRFSDCSLTYCTVYICVSITVASFVHVFLCLRFRVDEFTTDVIRTFVIKVIDPSELTRSTSHYVNIVTHEFYFFIFFFPDNFSRGRSNNIPN